MRVAGTLSKWNDDRGFGFITPDQGNQEIFVHISAFPKVEARPTLGEKLTFEIAIDDHKKKRASNVLCPQRPTVVGRPPPRGSPSYGRREQPGLVRWVVPLLLLAGVGVYGYSDYVHRTAPLPTFATEQKAEAASSPYRCDGRTHCSQMTSCAEATFFLRNCPNTQMDGNHDGVPCERQWCSSPWSG
jgi:cold shock CspA family protein